MMEKKYIKDRIALLETDWDMFVAQYKFADTVNRAKKLRNAIYETEQELNFLHGLLRRKIGWWNYIKYLITK